MTTRVFSCVLPRAGRVEVRIRPQAINILVGNESPSYSFDRAGRLIGAFVDGVNYKRGLDNRVLAKSPGDGGRERRWLDAAESRRLTEEAYRIADAAAVATGEAALAVLRAWDWAALEEDAARFAKVYRPVSILPPDQYLAVVLQATEGCSYNRCTFCDFYRDRPFRIKAPTEFGRHIAEVTEFIGAGMSLRKSIFLADANALVAPLPRVQGWLDAIAEARDNGRLPGGGIYSFIDAFDVHRKSVDEWQGLHARGVHRVYIGMESGDDALLRFLQKPGQAGDVVEAVAALKAGGLAVSLIVMTGIGGDYYRGHAANTVSALNAMPLAAGDIIYFSPFVVQPGGEYDERARAAGIRDLSGAEVAAQEAAIRAGLCPVDPGRPPQCSRYDIREFLY